MNEPTHFTLDNDRTLCDQPVRGLVMKTTTPTCVLCSNRWAADTGWSFPLPAIAVTTTL